MAPVYLWLIAGIGLSIMLVLLYHGQWRASLLVYVAGVVLWWGTHLTQATITDTEGWLVIGATTLAVMAVIACVIRQPDSGYE